MSETYAAWWPIHDDERSLRELSALALDDLARMVAKTHRIIDGPVHWGVREGEAGLVLLAKAPVSALHDPERCPTRQAGFQSCPPITSPQTAGGASTRDQAISQAPPTREGPRGRHQTTPVDVPAPPLPTTEETP